MYKQNPNLRAIKLWHSLCPRYFPLAIANAFFNNLSPYFNIYMSAEIINEIVGDRRIDIVSLLVVITLIGNLFISVIYNVLNIAFEHAVIILNQKESIFFNNKTLTLDYQNLENPQVRQKRQKIIESAKINYHGKQSLLNSINLLISNLINIIFSIYLFVEMLILILNNEINLLVLSFVIILVILITTNIWYSFFIKKNMAKISNRISLTMIDENRIDDAIDCYNMGKDVRLYCQDKLIMKIRRYTYNLHKEALKEMGRKQYKFEIPLIIMSNILQAITYIFVCIYAIWGVFGVGSIIKYIGFINRLIDSVIQLFYTIGTIKYNTPFIEDYLEYIDVGTKISKRTLNVEKKTIIKAGEYAYEIEFRDVSFKYPGSSVYALRHINMRIHTGEQVAIVGRNGSGKTTFIKLLCRLYDPTEGEILINGIDIKQYDYTEYMSIFSVVFQDFKLFAFSLGQNIATSVIYDDFKAKECLEKAGFGKRLIEMADGTETFLYKDFDEKGIEISGGEAQKIALARALYKESFFIILDEPTAALDPIAEYETYLKFKKTYNKKAHIYISHRLSSCRFCNHIVVFKNGQIIQEGSHNELILDGKGEYAEMWQAQARYYSE